MIHSTGHPILIGSVFGVQGIAAPRILADLAQRNLLPATQLIDGGYMNTHVFLTGQQYGVDMLGPTVRSYRRQATEGTGYALEQFQIDWERQVVTCPQGHPSRSWRVVDSGEQPSIAVRFDGPTCRACPVRAACTSKKSAARTLGFATQPVYTAMQAARQRQTTAAFKAAYALRSGVESTMAQHVQRFDGRTSRYRGLRRTHLQQVLIALATNLVRVIAWLWNEPMDEERRPPGAFARYAPHRLSRRTMLA